MTDTDTRRRKGIPPLAIIVVVLLALLAVIAWLGADGAFTSPDTGVSMPVSAPEESIMPNPQPPAAPVPRPS